MPISEGQMRDEQVMSFACNSHQPSRPACFYQTIGREVVYSTMRTNHWGNLKSNSIANACSTELCHHVTSSYVEIVLQSQRSCPERQLSRPRMLSSLSCVLFHAIAFGRCEWHCSGVRTAATTLELLDCPDGTASLKFFFLCSDAF